MGEQLTWLSQLDNPNRIANSKTAGAPFGLAPKKYQSREKDVTGGITRAGDEWCGVKKPPMFR